MAGRPRKSLNDRVRDRSFVAKRHRDLLDGPLVADPALRQVQERFRRESDLPERRALSREFERVLEGLPERTVLEAIRSMGFATFCETFLKDPKGHRAGKPFVIDGYQRQFGDEFDAVDEDGSRRYSVGILGVPRGCGKTAYAAARSLFELVRRPHMPEVFFAAASKDQARIAFGFAAAFVRGSPELSEHVVIQKDHLLTPATGGSMKVLPAIGATAYGLAPTVAVVDELWTWSADAQEELWTALLTATEKAPDAYLLAISTAADSDKSLLAKELEHEMSKPQVERPHDCLAVVRDPEAGRLTWWYGAPEDCDLDDEALWRRCNPASFKTTKSMRRLRKTLARDPDTFALLHLNRAGGTAEDALITRQAWNDCADETVEIPDGAVIRVGVETSFTGDCAAVVWLWKMPDGRVCVRSHVWSSSNDTPADEQVERVNLEDVAALIDRLAERYEITSVAYDREVVRVEPRWGTHHAIRSGSTEVTKTNRRLYMLISGMELIHNNDLVLAGHVCGTVGAWDKDERLRVYKGKQSRRVDGWYALSHALASLPERESIYGERGALVIDAGPPPLPLEERDVAAWHDSGLAMLPSVHDRGSETSGGRFRPLVGSDD